MCFQNFEKRLKNKLTKSWLKVGNSGIYFGFYEVSINYNEGKTMGKIKWVGMNMDENEIMSRFVYLKVLSTLITCLLSWIHVLQRLESK